MISPQEATRLIDLYWRYDSTIKLPLKDCLHALLWEPICADRAYPPINRSTMDGICLSYEEYQQGKRSFPLSGIIKAGDFLDRVDQHACYEIMTGAPVPSPLNLVIPYEEVELHQGEVFIKDQKKWNMFHHIHLQGSDCQSGKEIIPVGVKLNPARLSIAASFGYTELLVKKFPKTLVITTGDELVEVTSRPAPAQLRRSNAVAIEMALRSFGYSDVETAHLSDDPLAIQRHFEEHVEKYELLIYSGGVSKGKFDFLPAVWHKSGVECLFHQVSQRPGKPLWIGKQGERRVMGLPGNPVSALVCLYRYLLRPKAIWVKLDHEIHFTPPLTYFCPVKLNVIEDATLSAMPIQMNTSGDFSALSLSDGFVELEASKNNFEKGENVLFYSWEPYAY